MMIIMIRIIAYKFDDVHGKNDDNYDEEVDDDDDSTLNNVDHDKFDEDYDKKMMMKIMIRR